MLHTLFELQVDLTAHEINEDLQVVLGLDARGQGSSVSTAHVVTLAPPFPPVKNFVTGMFILAFIPTLRLTGLLVVLHHHPLHCQVQNAGVHHDWFPQSHITIPDQR